MKVMPSLALIATMSPLAAATTATFVIGDGFALNGTGSFGTTPFDNVQSSPGVAGRDNTINNAEVSTLINLTNSGALDAFGDPGDGFDPFVVGQIDFRPDVFRSGLTFDLSNIATAPAGFTYQVTGIELFLEVSGATFNNGLGAGESVDVGLFANLGIGPMTLPGTADATLTLNASDASFLNFTAPNTPFVSVSFATNLIDLNNDLSFEVLLDAGSNPDTAAVFGTSLAPGVGVDGTTSVAVSPALRITTELVPVPVPVPEPSSLLLSLFAGSLLILRRRRTA